LGSGIKKDNYLNKDVEMRVYSRIVFSQKIIVAIGFFVLIGFFVMSSCASNRFVNHGDGTVTDTNTGLMWATKDNGNPINWQTARYYCQNYNGGGHADWRMPTIDELAGLYDKSESYHAKLGSYDVHLTKLIQLTACCPWASETRGSTAAGFYFYTGHRIWFGRSGSCRRRALPVRGGN
jgi:hypothetical protein